MVREVQDVVLVLSTVPDNASAEAIARTLAQIPDPSTAAVVVPDVPGLRTERLHDTERSLPDSAGYAPDFLRVLFVAHNPPCSSLAN